MNLNNSQQHHGVPPQHAPLQNISLQATGQAVAARQNLRLADSKQSSQTSSGNGRTHRAILSQGNELQAQYPNAVPLGGAARGPADNQEEVAQQPPQASADLDKNYQNNVLLAAQQLSQNAARKGQAQLNSSRPNALHQSNFLDSKNVIPQQPDQLAAASGRPGPGVARLTSNQNWIQGQDYTNGTPSQASVLEQKLLLSQSQSQQREREANLQSTEEENPDGLRQNNPALPAETANPALAQQNPQFVRSLGRGSHPLGLGSVNSNSTATMTVATALSVHNSSDRQASLPVSKQSAPQPGPLPVYQQLGPQPPKQPYTHILQQNQQKDLQYGDKATFFHPLKTQLPQSSGRMKEPSVTGSSVIGSEALSRISGHAGLSHGNKTSGIKESRSPQMAMSSLLYAPGADAQHNLNDTQNSGKAFPNLGGSANTNPALQHKTPQIQLPSLLQNGAAANVSQQSNSTVTKAKSYQRAGVTYAYSHMKSPSASQADRDPYADRRNIQTGSLFQIRNKTTHSSINSGRKQIFSKSYATREQIGHASGSAGFANMARSIEIHEVTNSVERDRRESAESVEGNFFPEPIENEIKGRYQQNSRERRLRSLGGKPLSSDNYEITTQSQNDRINRLMSKKTSLPLENNVNHNNVLSTANSEQLPTLSPNRQTTKNAQVAGSAHLNNILSTLKKPAMVNGIITEHENMNASASPSYPLKASLQQQKTIPIYGNNGLIQTPGAAVQNGGLAMPGANPAQPFKANAVKMTQSRPPQAPVPTHLTMPVVQPNQAALPLPPSQQPQPQDAKPGAAPGEDPSAAQKTFDFHYVKILLRQSSSHSHSTSQKKASASKGDGQADGKQETFKEILLEREWLKKNRGAIPHFSEVISKVKETEGVEITMNCNSDAFYWLIDIVKIQTNYAYEFVRKGEDGQALEEMSPKERDFRVQEKFFEITPENCLNKLVTSHFLQIKWIYEQIWQQFLLENFPAVINSCKISLSNLNSEIVAHIAERVSDAQLEKLKDRRDKFLSNLYRARIEQKLLRYCSSKRAFQITDHSIFYCEDCKKILTLKQSRRISCRLEGNESRAFVDANGDLFVAHKFCDLNLQTDNYRVNQLVGPAANSTTPPPGQQVPIDMAQFIRFFRERYRLCWKEIYLKFASISRNYEPEQCTKCQTWFRFSDFVGCPIKPDPDDGVLHFHTVDPRTSLNCVTPEDILNYKRQIQVINDAYPQKQVEKMTKLMKERDKMKFVEPQSMNFEKKLSEAYLDFAASVDKKAKQKTEKELKPQKSLLIHGLPIVENDFEDLLYQGAQAQQRINWQLKGEPEMLKKFQRDAKAYVRDHPQGQNQTIVDKVGVGDLDGYSGNYDKLESAQGKRKLSPRSIIRVNKLVRKRINELKRETVFDDDGKSMQVLIQALQMQRTEAEAKKDKSMKKDKTLALNGLLEENKGSDAASRGNNLLTDIKIVKTHHQQALGQSGAQSRKPNKVMSDISQITQQQKKRNKKNQNSFSALGQQAAAQSTSSKPPTNPAYTSSGVNSHAHNNQVASTAHKDKEATSRVAQNSAREKAGAQNHPQQHNNQQHLNHNQNQTQAQPSTQNSQNVEPTPHTSTTQSSQRHGQGVTLNVRDTHNQYHLHVWDARDKFKNFPMHQHNLLQNQNGRSNSQNPSQLKVHNNNAQQAANIARSNSISSNDRGNTIQPQQFQFQHLQQKKDSSQNVNTIHNDPRTQIYQRQKSSQASCQNIRGNKNPSSFNVDQ